MRRHEEAYRGLAELGWQRAPSELLQDNAHEALNRWCDLTKDTLGLQVSIVLEEQWAQRCWPELHASNPVPGLTQHNPGEPHSLPSLPDGQSILGAK